MHLVLALAAIFSLEISLGSPLDLQTSIEAQANEILLRQLDSKRFLVYVRVFPPKKKPTQDLVKKNRLPFGAVAVDSEVLKKILEQAADPEIQSIDDIAFAMTLIFDEKVPKEQADLLVSVISERFSINAKKRQLTVRSAKLFNPMPPEEDTLKVSAQKLDSERFEIEKQRLQIESERVRSAADSERMKIELSKQDFELKRQVAEADQRRQDEEVKRLEAERKRILDLEELEKKKKEREKSSPLRALLSEFQTIIMALLVMAGVIVSWLLAGMFMRRGMSTVADGIKSIGPGLGEAFVAQVQAKSEADAAAVRAAAEAKAMEAQSQTPEEVKTDDELPLDPNWTSGQAPYETFIKQVHEKITVLAREKNFTFVQQFIDMVESEATIPYASALLVSLERETASLLLADLSAAHVSRLKANLSSEGGLVRAKALRSRALQEFYGRITIDEFSNSPLSRLKDIGWLTRMGAKEMADFSATLNNDQRAAFLACLSPLRAKQLLMAASGDAQRHLILDSFKGLEKVTPESINAFLNAIGKSVIARKTQATGGAVVDPIRYISSIVGDLSGDDQAKLFDSIKDNADLVAKLRDVYLPFNTVVSLRPEMIMEMFQGRSDLQIARTLYAAADDLRSKVLTAFPEIRRESIRDELRVLDADKGLAVRNRKVSFKLQGEYVKYLLKLAKEGMIQFDENTGTQQTPTAQRGSNDSDAA